MLPNKKDIKKPGASEDETAKKGADKGDKTPPSKETKKPDNSRSSSRDQDSGKPPFAKKGASGADGGKKVGASTKEKKSDPEIKDKVKVDLEPELNQEDLDFLLDGDHSDAGELQEVLSEVEDELAQIDEVLSLAGRLKRRSVMRRGRERVARARQRALARRATTKQITGRARRSAIGMLKQRFSGGRKADDLSNSEKTRVERIVERRKKAVERLTRRLIRGKRELEMNRLVAPK